MFCGYIRGRFQLHHLSNDNILVLSNLKALAENSFSKWLKWCNFLSWVENIVGKGENADNQDFLLFPQCFQKAFFPLGL